MGLLSKAEKVLEKQYLEQLSDQVRRIFNDAYRRQGIEFMEPKTHFTGLNVRFSPIKRPNICNHYSLTHPIFWPVMHVTNKGQVIRCPACGRRVVAKTYKRALRRWNREVRKK